MQQAQTTNHSWCLFLRSLRGVGPYGPEAKSHGLVTSQAAVFGGGHPLSVPRSCGTEPEGPPTTAAEVAQTFRQSLQKNHQERSGPFVHIIP